jgi:hypothetical protein
MQPHWLKLHWGLFFAIRFSEERYCFVGTVAGVLTPQLVAVHRTYDTASELQIPKSGKYIYLI